MNTTRPQQAPLCLSDLQNPKVGDSPGIRCRACGCPEFKVVYVRRIPGGIRRRRQCRDCGVRVTTTERSQGS